jgi:hypothetical protein
MCPGFAGVGMLGCGHAMDAEQRGAAARFVSGRRGPPRQLRPPAEGRRAGAPGEPRRAEQVRVATDHERRGVHREEDDAAGHYRLGPAAVGQGAKPVNSTSAVS